MSSNSNANNLLVRKKADESKLKSFNLSNHLVSLMFKEPFYTRIYRSINKIESKEVPTAGVTIVDNNFTLYWNREFFCSLTSREIQGLLKHEALHLVFEHVVKRKRTPHIIWNYSTDLAINSLIPIDELPKGGLIPGQRLPELTEEEKEKFSNEDYESYIQMSNLIHSLPSNKSSEYYFNILINDDNVNSIASKEKSLVGDIDFHGMWDNIDESNIDQINAKLEEIIKSATKEGESKGWGTVSASVRKNLIKRFSKKIKWSSLLKRFCGFSRSDERRSSVKRLNRKYPSIHPGIKKSYKPKIAIYVDESGSMSNEVLSLLYSELQSLSKHTEFYVYKFDSHVNEKDSFLWKKGRSVNIKRNLSGGTCFNAPTRHAVKNKKKFDGYIIMTDGCAPKPKISHGIKRGWILIPGTELQFEKDIKDVEIKMNK